MVVALQSEADLVLPRGGRPQGRSTPLGRSLAVRLCGMGPDNAVAAARALLTEGATALMTYGLAGALSPELPAGTLILPEGVVYRGSRRCVDASWRRRIEVRLSPRPVAGLLLTLPQPVVTAADKAEAYRTTGAAAVDMESGAVLDVAADAGVPGLVLRAVVDGASTSLPHAAVTGVDLYGRPRAAAMFAALLRRPWECVDCLRLGGDLRLALRSLQRAWSQLGPEGLAA